MAAARTQHCLAAILAVDVVGYGRLMQLDEVGITQPVHAYRIASKLAVSAAAARTLSDKPSVAVLPSSTGGPQIYH
jgi:hypothetical protein